MEITIYVRSVLNVGMRKGKFSGQFFFPVLVETIFASRDFFVGKKICRDICRVLTNT